jgi:hypothetical protein
MVHKNWLYAKSKLPGLRWTFLFTISGLGLEARATGSTGGGLHESMQAAGLSAHDLQSASWSPYFFFFESSMIEVCFAW